MTKSIQGYYVNRDVAHNQFRRILAGGTEKQIMVAEAPSGMGKTWLLAMLAAECTARNPAVPCTTIDLGDGQSHDSLSITQLARDDFGPVHFQELTKALDGGWAMNLNVVNNSTGEASVAVQVGTLSESTLAIAGANIIANNLIHLQANSDGLRRQHERMVTKAFLEGCQALLASGPIVILIDSYEMASEEAKTWIRSQLLPPVRDGKLAKLVIVIAGREVPQLDSAWDHCALKVQLHNLTKGDVDTYVRIRRKFTGIDPETLYRATLGNPYHLGIAADNIATGLGDAGWQ